MYHDDKMAHGKKNMIAAGKWSIVGFYVSRALKRCDCCDRIIRYVFQLENAITTAKDGAAAIPERTEVGIICGPRIFEESCKSFYEDPAKEWMRQFDRWANLVKYAILNSQNADAWAAVDVDLRATTDAIIDRLHDPKTPQETANRLVRVRDAKLHVLRTRRTGVAAARGARRALDAFNFRKRVKKLESAVAIAS